MTRHSHWFFGDEATSTSLVRKFCSRPVKSTRGTHWRTAARQDPNNFLQTIQIHAEQHKSDLKLPEQEARYKRGRERGAQSRIQALETMKTRMKLRLSSQEPHEKQEDPAGSSTRHVKEHRAVKKRPPPPSSSPSESDTDDSEDWNKSPDKEIPKKTAHICDTCGKLWSKKFHLIQHMRVHTGEKPFSCSVCDKSYSRELNLKDHMSTHTGEKRYSCNICNRKFHWLAQVKKHICVDKKPISKKSRCPHCGKSLISSSNLAAHLRIHTGEKPFSCPKCDKRFGFKGDVKQHLETHSEVKHDCPVCHKSYKSSLILRRHMRGLHAEKWAFSCSVCNKGFNDCSKYNRHVFSHSGETPYTCSVCYKSYKTKESLQGHISKHTGVRPFTCSICHKGFLRMSALKAHMTIHTGEKPHGCSDCGKCFRLPIDLKKHVLLHTKNKRCCA